jgi:hypothetical protein
MNVEMQKREKCRRSANEKIEMEEENGKYVIPI